MDTETKNPRKLGACQWGIVLLGLGISIPAWIMYWLEAWQRPLALLALDERWFPVAGIAGFLLSLIVWACGLRAASWRRRAGVAVLAAMCLGVFLMIGTFLARESAMGSLMRHSVVHEALVGSLPPAPKEPSQWLETIREGLESLGVPVPPQSDDPGEKPHSYLDEPLGHLLESSRWSVRREFMEKMMRDENGAAFLMNEWHSTFPAITGQDVTLARRKMMIEWLDTLANDQTAAPASRDAARFWMGLIVLSDSEAFARWRAPVRDAMLANEDPPVAKDGDVWMRILDMLLAADAPEARIALTGRLVRDPLLLRRALRERVRGIEGHVPALLEAMAAEDASGARLSAMAIWVDLKHLSERLPESAERGALHDRLRDTMAAWLLEDPMTLSSRFENHSNNYANISAADVMMDMPEETRARLDAHTHRIIETLGKESGTESEDRKSMWLPAEIQHVLLIRQFLDAEQRATLSDRLAGLMVERLWDDSGRIGVLMGHAGIWEDLTSERKARIGQLIRRYLEETTWDTKHQIIFLSVLGGIPLMQTSVGLEETEWLAIAAYRRPSTHWYEYPDTWWYPWQPQSHRFFSREAVEAVIAIYEKTALTLPDSIRFGTGDNALVFPKASYAMLLRRLRDEIPSRQLFLNFLAERGLAAVEDFPDEAMALMEEHPVLFAQLVYDPSQARLARWLDKPASLRLLLALPEDERYPGQMRGLPAYLLANPPPRAVMEEFLSHLRKRVADADRTTRIEAHRCLFMMMPFMSPSERGQFREDFYRFIMRDRPTTKELECQALWREDVLSAEFGWHSQITVETTMVPSRSIGKNHRNPAMPVFRYLMFACDVFREDFWEGFQSLPYPIDVPVPKRAWHGEPPDPAVAPTPWQSARQLSLRRPDLRFPDRIPYRPQPSAYPKREF